MDWLAGMSGFNYPKWRGAFYPKALKVEDWLAYYSQQLPAVEINDSFHRLPRSAVVADWAATVPAEFRFALKASRQITHQARLRDVEEPLDQLIRTVAVLEDKLGAVLFQLPPYLRKSAERLEQFLVQWPHDLPAAVEFRHPSWHTAEIMDLLSQYEFALAVSDVPEPAQLIATTDRCYLRLQHSEYTSSQLSAWIHKVEQLELTSALVFFDPESANTDPAIAQQFMRLARKPEPKRAAATTTDAKNKQGDGQLR